MENLSKIKIPGAYFDFAQQPNIEVFVFGEDAASREEYMAFIPEASFGVFWPAE